MNLEISPINFNARNSRQITRMVALDKNELTHKFKIVSENFTKITEIEHVKNGQLIRKYSNKKGFDGQRLSNIIDEIHADFKENFDFLFEFIRAQLKQNKLPKNS